MSVYSSLEQRIGNTPLFALHRLCKKERLNAKILAKLECCNPAGSIKDRVALSMLDAAREQGLLRPDTWIIEPTSGNTGIALAALSAARGYRCTIVMPENMSLERIKLISSYGASLLLTPAKQGMAGAIAAARKLASSHPNTWIPDQFSNPANPAAHRKTAEEIWQDTQGGLDIFVVGVGTGGTITGIGEYLKANNAQIQIVAVEPASSAVLSGKAAGMHSIQGLGAGFIPPVLDTQLLDEVIPVTDMDAIVTAQQATKTEGLSLGISSGAALWASLLIARRPENAEKTIVTIFPDSSERYLSTLLYA